MNQLNYGRAFISDSLGFHIIFACLGIGIPLIISIFELLSIIKKDEDYNLLAKSLGKGFLILFAIGTISGMIISFQLSLLWPKFMEMAGQVISLPFIIEGFFFLLETIFLIIYFFGWNKFKNRITHWLFSLPIIICSAGSGFAIVSANAWMNNPKGFEITNGNIINVDPIKAMFNPATPTETSHVIVSAYLFAALCIAGVFAFLILKNRNEQKTKIYRKGLKVTMIISLITILFTIFIGDLSAKYVASQEPIKLAAMEGNFKTQSQTPLRIGGIVDENNKKVDGDIEIPGGLSFLAFGDFNSTVKGLDNYDKSLWPPALIHYSFDIMVGSGMTILLITVIFFLKKYIKWQKLILWTVIISPFLALISIETGWITTEVGRQPYAIAGILTTKDAFTSSSSVAVFAVVFPFAYLFLLGVGIFTLIKFYKKYPL